MTSVPDRKLREQRLLLPIFRSGGELPSIGFGQESNQRIETMLTQGLSYAGIGGELLRRPRSHRRTESLDERAADILGQAQELARWRIVMGDGFLGRWSRAFTRSAASKHCPEKEDDQAEGDG